MNLCYGYLTSLLVFLLLQKHMYLLELGWCVNAALGIQPVLVFSFSTEAVLSHSQISLKCYT